MIRILANAKGQDVIVSRKGAKDMLIEVLRELADHESNSYADLAKKLNVNKDTINYLIEDLVRMGYIQLQEAACEDDDSCKGCPVGCRSNTSKMKIWEMTAKGKKILGIK